MALVPTVKIPELQPLTVGLDLDNADKLPIHIFSENKTKRVSLQQLSQFIVSGGGSSIPPAVWGAEVIYTVNALAAGTDTASIASLAGKSFTLERMGVPMIPLLPDLSNAAVADFEVLVAGGFKLTSNQPPLVLDERFKLQVFSLISTTPGNTTTPFIKGKRVIANTAALDPVNDANKIIQFRGTNTYITCTIPDLIDIPENTVFFLDASINQNKPVTVTTTGGQYFYFNNQSKTTIYIMPGEVCWIFRDADGFYFLNDFAKNYLNIGNPLSAFKKGLNQLVFNGAEVLRSDYPRLFEACQAFSGSYITKTLWQTASATVGGVEVLKPYRGCFYDGDGSTTFGLPDMMNTFLRGLLAETGTDAERLLNKAGGFQRNSFEEHNHRVDTTGNQSGVDPGRAIQRSNTNGDGYSNGSGGNDYIETVGGIETRPDNIGVLWICNT